MLPVVDLVDDCGPMRLVGGIDQGFSILLLAHRAGRGMSVQGWVLELRTQEMLESQVYYRVTMSYHHRAEGGKDKETHRCPGMCVSPCPKAWGQAYPNWRYMTVPL